MASMQCDIPELLEKLSDEARLYLLKRMASRNLTLLQWKRQVRQQHLHQLRRQGHCPHKRAEAVTSLINIKQLL